MTTHPDIQRDEVLADIEAAFERSVNAACTVNPLLATCSAVPEPRPLTIQEIRRTMAMLGYPVPETDGQRTLRHLREMGFVIRVVDPEAIFTIVTT